MKNAIIAAIVAAVISASGAFGAGANWDSWTHEQRQDDRIDRLQEKVRCLYQNRDNPKVYVQLCFGGLGVKGPR